MFLYINYPSWINPQIFPNIPFLSMFRWYGLMYFVAFGIAYLLLKQTLKEGMLDSNNYKATEDDIYGFIGTGIVFLIIGARIFSTLVYNAAAEYWKRPWLIFWPFQNGKFTGLAGMSYHGGFIGGFIGMLIWCKKHKQPLWKWVDAMACAIPLGFTFGRIGNFMNGELFGRITTMPWGIVYPQAERFSTTIPWVQEFASEIGMDISTLNIVTLPRHPSQLYEAFFEGVFLWLIIWNLRKHKKFDGMLAAVYTGGYGLVRFIIEYFREPDADIGYRFAKDPTAPIYKNTSLLNFSTGQLFCFIMIVTAIVASIILYHKNKKQQN